MILLYKVKMPGKRVITALTSASMNSYWNGQPTKQMQNQLVLMASGQISWG